MQITVNAPPKERKLVAVLGEFGLGVFLPNHNGVGSSFINSTGVVGQEAISLENLIAEPAVQRRPIYEGDTVTLQF